MKVKIIACMANNGIIGKDGSIPWKCSDDMHFFKFMTWDRIVIMGRKTFESIPNGPLEGRTSYIITSANVDEIPFTIGKRYFNSLEEAIERAKFTEKLYPDMDDCWIIGGASIYKQAIPLADEIFLNVLYDDYEGDTHMPPFEDKYRLVSSKNKKNFIAEHYERIKE